MRAQLAISVNQNADSASRGCGEDVTNEAAVTDVLTGDANANHIAGAGDVASCVATYGGIAITSAVQKRYVSYGGIVCSSAVAKQRGMTDSRVLKADAIAIESGFTESCIVVAGVDLKLSTAVGNFDRTVAGTKRNLSGNSVERN